MAGVCRGDCLCLQAHTAVALQQARIAVALQQVRIVLLGRIPHCRPVNPVNVLPADPVRSTLVLPAQAMVLQAQQRRLHLPLHWQQ